MSDLLLDLGYVGMLLGAFLAGSVFPFSSEVLLTGFLLGGLDPWILFATATVGNVAGSMFNYYIGSHSHLDVIERRLHIKPERIERTRLFLDRHPLCSGVLSIVPFVGSAVTVTLGYTHANFWRAFINIAIVKAARYWLLIFVVDKITES